MSAAKKRVLSLATLYPNAVNPRFGTFVARQLEALAARDDWDVTVINPIGVPPIPFGHYRKLSDAAVDGMEHGVQVYRPKFFLIPKLGGRINPQMIAGAALPMATRLHKEQPFDLVDAQFFYPDGPAAMRLARVLDLPLSIKARGADISYWGQTSYGRDAMAAAAGDAAGLLSVSEALARDMAEIGLPDDKITIHYTGLDRAKFHPMDLAQARNDLALKLDLDVPLDVPLFTSVGALIPRKGQEFAINALSALPQGQLALVGTGPDRAKLEQLAGRLGLSQRVHFLGSIDHQLLPAVLSASQAMVLPSESEGLANAWVEALACGTPLVITDAGGARELVKAPEAGVIVPRNSDAIAAALNRLLADPPSPEQVAATVAHFSWEANATQLAEYYSRIAAAGR